MKSIEIKIINKVGLHARPATLFVQESQTFESEIFVIYEGSKVNGKSLLSLLSLGIAQGSNINIEADGKDEEIAIKKLSKLIEGDFGEK